MPETKVPALPEPSTITDPHLRRVLAAVKEALDIRLGRRGDPLDRAVTVRELAQSGVVRVKGKVVQVDPRGEMEAVAGSPEPVLPPAPRNLVINTSFQTALLSWDRPTYFRHSLTEIWRAEADDLSQATLVGTSNAAVGSDRIEYTEGVQYFYWIRFRSDTGHIGPYNSTSGTLAIPTPDVEFLMGVLADGNENAAPFYNNPTETVINGVVVPAGVYMKGAFIQNASIDSAKIISVNANQINTETLSAITSNIGEITTGVIRSVDNRVQINMTEGTFRVRSGVSGARLDISDNVIRVYDANGVLRVKLGNLSA